MLNSVIVKEYCGMKFGVEATQPNALYLLQARYGM